MIANFSDRTLEALTIVLDGKRFVRCQVVRCRLIYKGGKLPIFEDTRLIDCNFLMKDAAANTLSFLGVLYRNGESGLVDSLVAQLKGHVGVTQLPSLEKMPE